MFLARIWLLGVQLSLLGLHRRRRSLRLRLRRGCSVLSSLLSTALTFSTSRLRFLDPSFAGFLILGFLSGEKNAQVRKTSGRNMCELY